MTVRNRGPAKLDEPRLVGMKVQSEASEPRFEIGKELLCLVPVLEADDIVVRVAHDNHVTGGASLPPLVDPLIIDMMEIDVRQERACHALNAKDNLCVLMSRTCWILAAPRCEARWL